MWRLGVAGEGFPGVLSLVDDQPYLVVYLPNCEDGLGGTALLNATEPPSQPTLVGDSRDGIFTLDRCVRRNLRRVGSRIELELSPCTVWRWHKQLDIDGLVAGYAIQVPGLHNVLSTFEVRTHSFMKTYPGADPEADSAKLHALTGAEHAVIVRKGPTPAADIRYRGKAFAVELFSWLGHGWSSHEGVDVQSRDSIQIRGDNASLKETADVAREVQAFLSVFCMGPIAPSSVTAHPDPDDLPAHRIWDLARCARLTTELNVHQVWFRLGREPETFRRALQRWFDVDEERRLARWLICDALEQTTLSTSRFLGVAQAWEILGRAFHDGRRHDKSALSDASAEIHPILERHLGTDAANRLVGGMLSSNTASFRDLVKAGLRKLPNFAAQSLCGDINAFAAKVAATRNALTHMRGSKKLTLDDAAAAAGDLTLKLLTAYCILEAVELGLPMSNLQSVLRHNDLARMATWSGSTIRAII